ncbi:MAG: ATP-binding protein, partial [Candidatus Aminicenantes bacterium]
ASKVLRQKGGNIRVKLDKKNKNVEVSVKDDGPGIPRELRNKILKEQVLSKNGLGLGLYLCGKTIKQFGGRLKVKTADGEGTTITMILPAVEEKKE